jgi:hypothetical protein
MLIRGNHRWYAAGLNFECRQCGNCCSGPGSGYIWITRPEIKFIAEFLKIPVKQLRQKYLKRVGFRTSIVENPATRDCIFLQANGSQKKCVIYPVRPTQCRTWPFWPDNLAGPDAWNTAVRKCPGINQGRLYSFEKIEKIRKQKNWWANNQQQLISKVAEIYNALDLQIRQHASAAGRCETCGRCCDFDAFDHRLFVTAPELMYLSANIGIENIKPMSSGKCPYNVDGKCTIYKYRFAGCRIFCCKADKDFQSRLSESALGKFKSLCEEFDVPYRYTDLPTALNNPVNG